MTEGFRAGLKREIEESCRERRASGKDRWTEQGGGKSSSMSLIKQKWSRWEPGDLSRDIMHFSPLTCF